MHSGLALGGRRPQLEPQLASVGELMQFRKRVGAHILGREAEGQGGVALRGGHTHEAVSVASRSTSQTRTHCVGTPDCLSVSLRTTHLEPMAHSLHHVRDVRTNRTLVNHGTAHALRDLERVVRFAKVALRRPLCHRIDRAHAAVLLEANAILRGVNA